MVVKEFIQMRRDRLTFGMMIGIPLIQLILFGFAINSDPKHLPAAVLLADRGPQGRTLLYAIRNSGYFDFVREARTEAEARDLLARGEVQFVINIPEDFTRSLLRGDRPAILVEADATDPAATGNALGALRTLIEHGPGERPRRARSPSWPRRSRRSICASTRCTTRKPSRSTTSCPA